MTPEEMARLYRSGYSTHRIGERAGLDSKTVWYHLKRHGVQMRDRNVRRRRAFVDSCGYVAWGQRRVHRIVCEAWHGPPPSDKHGVNHIDGDKLNNHPDNLEWATQAENIRHAYRLGLNPVGSAHYAAKLDRAAVCAARDAYRRGEPAAGLAERHGVALGTMYDAIRGRTWAHVTEVPPVTPDETSGEARCDCDYNSMEAA